MSTEPSPSPNNGSSALAKVLSQLNIPTLLAVMLFGGGNWVATNKDGESTRHEASRARAQIADLHSSLDQFERRQKASLENQAQLLRNQGAILEILKEGQKQYLQRQQKLFEQHP